MNKTYPQNTFYIGDTVKVIETGVEFVINQICADINKNMCYKGTNINFHSTSELHLIPSLTKPRIFDPPIDAEYNGRRVKLHVVWEANKGEVISELIRGDTHITTNTSFISLLIENKYMNADQCTFHSTKNGRQTRLRRNTNPGWFPWEFGGMNFIGGVKDYQFRDVDPDTLEPTEPKEFLLEYMEEN